MIYIYSITNLKNKKRYIGITTNTYNRKRVHFWALDNDKHSNKKLQNAYNKYRKECFAFEIVETIETEDRMLALQRESFYIKKYDSYRKGYNKSLGFDGSALQKRTEETSIKMSDFMRGNKYWLGKHHSEESKKKIGLAHKNKIISEETKEKLSKALKGKMVGDKNPFYNKKHSQKTKAKIKEKVAKKVICIETGTVFASAVDCSKNMGIDRSNISKVCRGVVKTAGGYSFKYL